QNTSNFCAICGLADKPPPTHTWKPMTSSPSISFFAGVNAKSLISAWPVLRVLAEIEILYFRGKLENSRFIKKYFSSSSTSGLVSSASFGSIPANGLPTIVLGQSPHASKEDKPTDAKRSKISGNDSTVN